MENTVPVNVVNFMGYKRYVSRCLSVFPPPEPIKRIGEVPLLVELLDDMLQWNILARPSAAYVKTQLIEIAKSINATIIVKPHDWNHDTLEIASFQENERESLVSELEKTVAVYTFLGKPAA